MLQSICRCPDLSRCPSLSSTRSAGRQPLPRGAPAAIRKYNCINTQRASYSRLSLTRVTYPMYGKFQHVWTCACVYLFIYVENLDCRSIEGRTEPSSTRRWRGGWELLTGIQRTVQRHGVAITRCALQSLRIDLDHTGSSWVHTIAFLMVNVQQYCICKLLSTVLSLALLCPLQRLSLPLRSAFPGVGHAPTATPHITDRQEYTICHVGYRA